MLVRQGSEHGTSRSADRRSPNWANQAVVAWVHTDVSSFPRIFQRQIQFVQWRTWFPHNSTQPSPLAKSGFDCKDGCIATGLPPRNPVDSCPFFFVFAQKTKKEQWKKKWIKGWGKGRNKVRKNTPVTCLSPGDRRKIVNSWIQKIWTEMLDLRKLRKIGRHKFCSNYICPGVNFPLKVV